MTPLAEGAVVGGRYRLDRRIGTGGMGEVWAATQTVTRKPVALKFLKATASGDADVRRRMLREARAACAVRHPNVVEIHDVLEVDDGAPVLVMELLRGESLEARLKRQQRMPVGEAASVLLRVVGAVAAAHALGIVHRDLKPENIFLAQTPEGVEVKVLDFGIAKLTALDGDAAQTGGLTSTGAILGTPYYMSPEQAFGEKKLDHRADIWSLGIILYRALTGVLPTRADNIGQVLKIIMTSSIPRLEDVAPELPEDLRALIGRMLSIDPAKRPSDLAEVRSVLEAHAGEIAAIAPDRAPNAELDRKLSSLEEASSRARAQAMTPASSPRRSSALVPLVIGLALAAGVATAVFARRASRPDPASSSAAAQVTPPPPASAAGPVELLASSSALSSSAPPLSASPPASSPRTSPTGRVAAPPPATVAATGAAQPLAPPSAATTSIGGVLVKPPF